MSMMPLDLPEFLLEAPPPSNPLPPPTPLSFGELLGETWRILTENLWLWLKLGLLAMVPLFLFSGCFLAYLTTSPMFRQQAYAGYAENQFTPILCLIVPIAIALSVFWSVTFTAGGTHLAGQIYRGEYFGMLDSVGYVWRERFWSLVGAGLIIGLLTIGIIIVIFIGLEISEICILAAIPLFLFMMYASYCLQLLSPVIVLERESLGTLINRTWHLGKAHFWTIVGGMFVLGIIDALINLVSNIFNRLFDMVCLQLPVSLLIALVGLFTQAATLIFMTLVYYDARVRLERPTTEDEFMTGTPPDIFTGEPFMIGRDYGNMFGLAIIFVVVFGCIFMAMMAFVPTGW